MPYIVGTQIFQLQPKVKSEICSSAAQCRTSLCCAEERIDKGVFVRSVNLFKSVSRADIKVYSNY